MTGPGSFQIIITAGLWRGIDVRVEPPASNRPMRHFRNHSEAMAFAEDLARVEQWPIVDRTPGCDT